jgi:hypothetical protein
VPQGVQSVTGSSFRSHGKQVLPYPNQEIPGPRSPRRKSGRRYNTSRSSSAPGIHRCL